MWKYSFLGILLLVGCQPTPTTLPSVPAGVNAPPKTIVARPEPPVAAEKQKPAVPPMIPSQSYLKGYWDGYNGTWLAPARWLVRDEYRQGWSQGNKDRKEGVERYPPELRYKKRINGE